MSRKRRNRHRGGSGGRGKFVILLVSLCLATTALFPITPLFKTSSAFTSMNVTRSGTMNVTEDGNSVLEMDKASSVSAGSTSKLENVTNNFGQEMTVEVHLREVSQDDADLIISGMNVGETATFDLGNSKTQTVKVKTKDSVNLTDDHIYFNTNATTTGVEAIVQNRSIPIN